MGCWCCFHEESVDTIDTSHCPIMNTVSQQTSTDVRHANTVVAGKQNPTSNSLRLPPKEPFGKSNKPTTRPLPIPNNFRPTSSVPQLNHTSINLRIQSTGKAPTKQKTVSEFRSGISNKAPTRPLPIPKNIVPTSSGSQLNPTPIRQKIPPNKPSKITGVINGKNDKAVTRPLPIPKNIIPNSSVPQLNNTPIKQRILSKETRKAVQRSVSPKRQPTPTKYISNSTEEDNTKEHPVSQNQSQQRTTRQLPEPQISNIPQKGTKKKKRKSGRSKASLQHTDTSSKKERKSEEKESVSRASTKERPQQSRQTSHERSRGNTENTNNAEREMLNGRGLDENGAEFTIVNGVYIPKLDLSWLDEDDDVVGRRIAEEQSEKRRSIRSRIRSARKKRIRKAALEREALQQSKVKDEDNGTMEVEEIDNIIKQDESEQSKSKRRKHVRQSKNNNAIEEFEKDCLYKKSNVDFLQYTEYSVFLASSVFSRIQKNTEGKSKPVEKIEATIGANGCSVVSEEIKKKKKSLKDKWMELKKYLTLKKNQWTAKVSSDKGEIIQVPKESKEIFKFSKF